MKKNIKLGNVVYVNFTRANKNAIEEKGHKHSTLFSIWGEIKKISSFMFTKKNGILLGKGLVKVAFFIIEKYMRFRLMGQ